MAQIRFLHAGQEKKQGKGFFLGANFLKAFCRPFISSYPTHLLYCVAEQYMEKICEENKAVMRYKTAHELLSSLFRALQIPFENSKVLRIKTLKKRVPFSVCPHCFKLFGHAELNYASQHFCTNRNLDRQNFKEILIPDDDPIVTSYLFNQMNQLSDDQKHFVNSVLCENNKNNLLLTGGAGTGKSHTLLCAIYALKLKYGDNVVGVVAMTKNAATIVNGETINSFFNIGMTDLIFSNLQSITSALIGHNLRKYEDLR